MQIPLTLIVCWAGILFIGSVESFFKQDFGKDATSFVTCAYHSFRFLPVNGCGRCLLSQNRSTYRYGVQQMLFIILW
jgi:hypothetical protein